MAGVQGQYHVVIRLVDGEQLRAEAVATAEDAERAAEAIADRFRTAGAWPRFGGRLVQPSAVVSVDVVEERPAPWEGSPSRRIGDE
jgi:hypothetical protein